MKKTSYVFAILEHIHSCTPLTVTLLSIPAQGDAYEVRACNCKHQRAVVHTMSFRSADSAALCCLPHEGSTERRASTDHFKTAPCVVTLCCMCSACVCRW